MKILALVTLCATLGLAPERPLITVEVPFVDMTAGAEFTIVGQYQSLMGDRLSLESCDLEFELGEGRDFPVLRSIDLRSIPIAVRCRVVPGNSGTNELHVISVTKGPSPDAVLEKIELDYGDIGDHRRLAIARWILGRLSSDSDPAEVKRAITLLEKCVDALIKGSPNSETATRAFQIFREHRDLLEPRALWSTGLPRLAHRLPKSDALTRDMQSLGFVVDETRWVSEGEFLEALGLRRLGERIVTRERAELESVIDEWVESGRRKSLLRGLTNAQYDGHSKKRRLREGMNRTEALRAWGYPGDVTWAKRSNETFEVWVYPNRRLFLVESLVFDWEEE